MISLAPALRWLGPVLSMVLLLWACQADDGQQRPPDNPTTGTPTPPDAPGANLRLRDDSARTRSLAPAGDFDFAAQFPRLYGLVREDEQMRKTLGQYAERVVMRQGLNSEADLMALFQRRKEAIIPRLEPFFENNSDAVLRQFDAYERELNRLGLSVTMAEGMITGLGPAPMLGELVEQLGSPSFRAYQRFLTAQTESRNGEYPFMNMGPYERMVLAGEELMARAPNPYWDQVEEDFYDALAVVSDLHLVQNAQNREGEGTPLVGDLNTEFYPYAAEIGSLKDFAQRHPSSPMAQAVQRIAENPSQMSERPENLYVIVLDWKQQEPNARQAVRSYLRQGEDIPHVLPIQRSDGSVEYAVVYRFFENSDRADQALDRIRQTHPEAELIFCSVKGEQLYQLGPSAQ